MNSIVLLAHSAGNVWEYKRMLSELSDEFELLPVELPGNVTRWGDERYTELSEYVDEICSFIDSNTDKNDKLYLFGHSFGGYLIYETAARFRDRIAGVTVSCCQPYHVYIKPVKGSEESFCSMFGYSNNMAKELIDMFEPIIEDQINVTDKHCERYKNIKMFTPLNVVSDVIYAENDDPLCGSEKWYDYFCRSLCNINRVNGGHFYWNDDPKNISFLENVIRRQKRRYSALCQK